MNWEDVKPADQIRVDGEWVTVTSRGKLIGNMVRFTTIDERLLVVVPANQPIEVR